MTYAKPEKISTFYALMAEFQTATVPLGAVCEKFLALSEAKAKARAARQELPFPVFRGNTNKSPWLVNIGDLAEWIDMKAAEARDEWKKVNC